MIRYRAGLLAGDGTGGVQRTAPVAGDGQWVRTGPVQSTGPVSDTAAQQTPTFRTGGILADPYNPFGSRSAGMFDQYMAHSYMPRVTPPMLQGSPFQSQGGFYGFNAPQLTRLQPSTADIIRLLRELEASGLLPGGGGRGGGGGGGDESGGPGGP